MPQRNAANNQFQPTQKPLRAFRSAELGRNPPMKRTRDETARLGSRIPATLPVLATDWLPTAPNSGALRAHRFTSSCAVLLG